MAPDGSSENRPLRLCLVEEQGVLGDLLCVCLSFISSSWWILNAPVCGMWRKQGRLGVFMQDLWGSYPRALGTCWSPRRLAVAGPRLRFVEEEMAQEFWRQMDA